MFKRKKKTAPIIPPRVVNIDKGFYDLSFEEQRALLAGLLSSMSPNEEVRSKARKDETTRGNQA